MGVGALVYLNGALVDAAAASISPFDRGFLFAHAAYEVTAVYGGQMVDFDGHIARLQRTLEGLSIPNPHSKAEWAGIHQRLISANGLREGLIYLQVTAGDYGARDFAGPDVLDANIFLYSDAKPLINDAARDGIAAITLEDTRWKRRDFKTTQLLSQALAYRAARAAGAQTAVMIEDGYVTEAASANVWMVTGGGALVTRDLSPAILAGITRETVQRRAYVAGLEIETRSFTPAELTGAAEAFTSSAGAMIAPIVTLDGADIGSGAPGPVTRKVQRLYYEAMGADVAAVAPWVLD